MGAGVIPSFNIIFGFPGEGPKERRETVNFMMDICRLSGRGILDEYFHTIPRFTDYSRVGQDRN